MLTQVHQDQDCPEPSQLKKTFDRYFHGYQIKDLFKDINANCQVCQARQRIPKEWKHFKSITNPESPGVTFVSDVIKRSKQLIFTTRDAFSDFVTTAIILSEKAEDLKEGIIVTTSSVRRKSDISVRVDNAPGFQSLVSSKDKDLEKLGISLDLSDSTNKNGIAIVDKAIQELEKEIVAISPDNRPLSSSDLAKATIALNSRIRSRDLSSYEIMFSREQNTGENIKLDDKSMSTTKMNLKEKNHQYSEKSKFENFLEPKSAHAEQGDFVFMKKDGGKHQLRDLYIVTECKDDKVTLIKMLHSVNRNEKTKLSSKKIEAFQTDIYKSNIYNSEKFQSTNKNDIFSDCEETDQVIQTKLSKNVEPKSKVSRKLETPKKSVWSPFAPDATTSSSESDTSSDAINDDQEDSFSDDASDQDFSDTDTNDSTNAIEDDMVNLDNLQDLQESASMPDEVSNENEEVSNEDETEVRDELFNFDAPNPPLFPKLGDRITFVDKDASHPKLVNATVTKIYKTVQKKWPGWFNVRREDFMLESSVDLLATRWRYVPQSEDETEDLLDTRPAPVDVHNNAFEEAPPSNDQLYMPFGEVQNLEEILPLTSTPTPQVPTERIHSRPRISDVRPRGLLPMERENSHDHPSPSSGMSRFRQAVTNRAAQVQKLLSGDLSSSDSE